MGVFAGPDVSESGLVLALDGANYKSFKGESITNLYYADAGSSANNSIFHMPMGGTATGSYTTSHSYGSWSGNTIFKVTVSSGTLAGGYESFRSCVSSSFDSTYGTTRRLSAKVKMLKGSITSLGYHSGGGTGGHNSSHYTPISESSVPTDVLSKDGWYQFDMDVSGSYPYGHCVGIGIVGSDIEFLVTEMMLYPSSSFVRFTPTTRGTTVAAGGGWADLTGNGNNGELVNGVRESSDNLGALVFDGTDDTISFPFDLNYIPALSNFSMEIWMRIDTFPTPTASANQYGNNQRAGVLFGSMYYGGVAFYWTGNSTGTSMNVYPVIRGQDAYINATLISINLNTWYNLVLVNNYSSSKFQFYVNGSLYSEVTGPTQEYNPSFVSVAGNIGISKPQVDGGGTLNYSYLDCDISIAKIYKNKALTSAEVSQNFNALRGRFGI